MAKQDDSSTESWNRIADDWIAHADTNDYRNHFLMPRMLELLGDVRGRTILDVGCGEGGYARELTRRGARVTGVDGSGRLIEVARERASDAGLKVNFLCANASRMPEAPSDSFDVAVASMSLMDVDDYEGAIAEIHRVLRPGGELLMSITHPCFQPRDARWEKDWKGERKFFKVDNYFKEQSWEEMLAASFRQPVVRRHRTLQTYMAAPLKRGFVLLEYIEPVPTDDEIAKSERFRRLRRIPYFLFMSWAKL